MTEYSASEVPSLKAKPGKVGIFIEKFRDLCVIMLDVVKTRSDLSIVKTEYEGHLRSIVGYKIFLERTPYGETQDRHMSVLHQFVLSNLHDTMSGLEPEFFTNQSDHKVIYCNGDTGSNIKLDISYAMKTVIELKNMFDEDNSLSQPEDIVYPPYYKYDQAILLYLYRCLECIDFGPYNTNISGHVQRLEISIGLKKKSVPSTGSPFAGIADILGGNGGEGIGKVVKMAINIAGEMGVAPPDGAEGLDDQAITDGITRIINNQGTKDMMNDMTAGISENPEDIGKMIPNLFNTLLTNQDKIGEIAKESGINLDNLTADPNAPSTSGVSHDLIAFSDEEGEDDNDGGDDEGDDVSNDDSGSSVKATDQESGDDFNDDDIIYE